MNLNVYNYYYSLMLTVRRSSLQTDVKAKSMNWAWTTPPEAPMWPVSEMNSVVDSWRRWESAIVGMEPSWW